MRRRLGEPPGPAWPGISKVMYRRVSPLSSFRLAHLSDLHLPMEGMYLEPRDYFTKRVLSHISWRTSRYLKHRPEVLALVAADMASHLPDHVAVTGDLCNLSLPDEFSAARDWLQDMGVAFQLTAIAGNHDALIASSDVARGFAQWQPWMSGDAQSAPAFPFLRQRGPVALIGVNTAEPTPPFMATGHVGEQQMHDLKGLLLSARERSLCRIVLIHHPLNDDAAVERKQLRDRAELRALLAETGAELVLHGHTHETGFRSIPGPDGDIPVIGVPSASAISESPMRRAGWNLISITRNPVGQKVNWRIEIVARRLKGGEMVETERRNVL
jgi:3',5'-cyclic AMP phosphodiesterase CpdA